MPDRVRCPHCGVLPPKRKPSQRLPHEPLRRLVIARCAEVGQAAVGRRVGVSADAVRRRLSSPQALVNVGTADRWAIALGSSLQELYG